MTITIINATPAKEVVKQVVCRNCGVTLEYTPNDVKESRRTDYTGCVDVYKVIGCANCNASITVGC